MRKPLLYLTFYFTLSSGPHLNAARLGDLHDEQPNVTRAKKNKPEEDSYSPEEKKQLVSQLSNDYYKKGVTALREDRLQEAKAYFEKVLALSPNHSRAQGHLSSITKKLAEQKKGVNSVSQEKPRRPAEEKLKPAKKNPSPKTIAPEEPRKKIEVDKQKSDNLYYQALSASQNKEKAKALELCRQALKFNPANLQAQRMLDRLSQ